jgi:hypothetical protein
MFIKVELTEQELYTVLQLLQSHPIVTSLTKLHMQAVALQTPATSSENSASTQEPEIANP